MDIYYVWVCVLVCVCVFVCVCVCVCVCVYVCVYGNFVDLRGASRAPFPSWDTAVVIFVVCAEPGST